MVRIDSAAGVIIAQAVREPALISMPAVLASPPASEDRPNSDVPATSRRPRPASSAARLRPDRGHRRVERHDPAGLSRRRPSQRAALTRTRLALSVLRQRPDLRAGDPLAELSIFRIKGLGTADAAQVIAQAGFYSAGVPHRHPAVFVGVQTAANTGVPADKAGLAALITASSTLGGALGLVILSAIATGRTQHLLAAHATPPAALTARIQLTLTACSAAAVIAARAASPRSQHAPGREPA